MPAIITFPATTPVGIAIVTLAELPTACDAATKGIEQGEHCADKIKDEREMIKVRV